MNGYLWTHKFLFGAPLPVDLLALLLYAALLGLPSWVLVAWVRRRRAYRIRQAALAISLADHSAREQYASLVSSWPPPPDANRNGKGESAPDAAGGR